MPARPSITVALATALALSGPAVVDLVSGLPAVVVDLEATLG